MIRYDRVDAPTWMIESFTQTSEGFLKGRACVTNIGVFPYRLADGSIEYELRHPEDVFEQASMDSLRMKPVTNEHPKEAVTADNIKLFQVGNLGDNPFNGDNIHLTIDMIVQDAGTIEDILRGKRELSCGYTADIIDESGVWLGMPYTKRQKNIRYNHVAVVDNARAGEAARIKLDSGEGVLVTVFEKAALAVDNKSKQEDRMADNMKTIQLDAVDYQAEQAVIDAYKSEKTRADSFAGELEVTKSKISTLEAERDSAKEKLDAVEVKIAELEKNHLDEAEISKRVTARLDLVLLAKEAGVEVADSASDLEIKKAIVVAKSPKLNLDGKDETYISVRLDCIREDMVTAKEKLADSSVMSANTTTTTVEKNDSAEAAYDRMIAKLDAQGRK